MATNHAHGTAARYQAPRDCRCERCRAAWREYLRAYRARFNATRAAHGRVATYSRGCRCDQCRVAWRDYFRARRAMLARVWWRAA